jgi:2-polyprenyl-3-methyl-5-hydroxy-6-metoxy-1,4-benzoquinol methylase
LANPALYLLNTWKRDLPNGKALDICYGLGTTTVYLAKNGFNVTGIDVSRTAIEAAKKKSQQCKESINFLNESFITLPFIDEAFDFVFDMGRFHHVEVEERSIFIAIVHRVLKEGMCT